MLGFGIVQLRLFALIFGLLCIASWGMTVRCLCRSTGAGLAAAGLIAADYFVLNGSSHGRMDMMCASFGAAAIALYLNLRERSPGQAVFWGHSLAAVAVLCHPVGLLYSGGLALLTLWWDRRSLSVPLLGLMAVPYLAAAIGWGAYIAVDPQEFARQFFGNVHTSRTTYAGLHSTGNPLWAALRAELQNRYIGPFGLAPGMGLASRIKALVLAAYVAGLAGLLAVRKLRNERGPVFLSGFFVVAFLVLTFISPSKFFYYLPHTTTIMAAAFGALMFHFFRAGKRLAATVAVAVVMVIGIAGAGYRVRQDLYRHSYQQTIAAILSRSPENGVVMAPGELWFGLLGHREFVYDVDLGFRTGIRPRLFVMNEFLRGMHRQVRREDSPAYGFIQSLMDRSRIIYQDANYQVWMPPAS
jgi:hypothetical protein